MKSDLRKPMLVSHRIIDNARQDALNPETVAKQVSVLRIRTLKQRTPS